MRKVLLVLLCLLIAAGLAFSILRTSGLTITLTQEGLQKQVESKFPLQRSIGPGVQLTLENPQVQLKEGSDRIGISMDVSNQQGPVRLQGAVTISGALHYDANARAFFLQQASLDEISPRPLEKLRPILSAAVSEKLKSTPLKGPENESVTRRLINASLDSVVVKDGKVQATFKLN
ncbi:MAG: hypothetical protein AMXMBFR33_69190 [Candidatus Xenobia bacterium]